MATQKGNTKSWTLDRERSMVMRAAEQGLSNLVILALDAVPEGDAHQLAQANNPQDAPLVTACLKGHLDVARNLIEKCHASLECCADITVKKQHVKGATPLWAAACSGNAELVRYLIQKGASVNSTTETNSTPLRAASYEGHLPVVRLLVENGADVNSVNSYGHSNLMIACHNEHKDVVSFLLDHGAEVNYVAPDIEGSAFVGETALHMSAWPGNVQISKLLMARGASITQNKNGETPLLKAVVKGHHDLVSYLVVTPDCSRDDKADALELLGSSVWREKEDMDGCLSLWQRAMEERHRPGRPVARKREASNKVAAYGNATEVQSPAELRSLATSTDKWRVGVQAMLICERVLGKHNEMTCRVIRYCAAVQADSDRFDRAVEVMFHAVHNLSDLDPFTCDLGDQCVLLLGVLFDGRNAEGPGAATFSHTLQSLKQMLSVFQRGKEVEPESEAEENRQNMLKIVLHLVCLLHRDLDTATADERNKMKTEVSSLVKLKLRGRGGNTLLHMACDEDTTVFDQYEDHYVACDFPAVDCVKALLQAGCPANTHNEAGLTALQVAQKQDGDHSDIISLLKSAGAD